MKPTKILFLLLLCPFVIFAQNDATSAKSVVKIQTSYRGKDPKGNPAQIVNTSTGWVWNDPQWVVATLHSVAGVQKIEVCTTTDNCTGATVVKVLKEADLALLKLNRSLGLQPLQTENVSPQSTSTYFIWGYPHGVPSITGDEIKFSRSLSRIPTLNDIIAGNKLKNELLNQGYPSPNAQIYRISSIIQPGHSGAPILTSSGKVIGIADGGLRGGTARLNWAMPSETYLRRLASSSDAIPRTVSIQQNLYSSPYYLPITVEESNYDAYIAEEESRSVVSSDAGKSLNKTWTAASYYDLLNTLDDEDWEDMQDFISDLDENFIDELYFDVYEDFETGASFAVPYGSAVTYDEGLFHVKFGSFDFAFIPANYDTYQEAYNDLHAFINNILDGLEDAREVDDFEAEEESDAYEEYAFRNEFREDGSNLYVIGGEVMQSDLAVYIVVSPTYDEMTYEQLNDFFRLAVASEFISFSGH